MANYDNGSHNTHGCVECVVHDWRGDHRCNMQGTAGSGEKRHLVQPGVGPEARVLALPRHVRHVTKIDQIHALFEALHPQFRGVPFQRIVTIPAVQHLRRPPPTNSTVLLVDKHVRAVVPRLQLSDIGQLCPGMLCGGNTAHACKTKRKQQQQQQQRTGCRPH